MSVGPDVATGDIPAPQLRRPLKTVWRIVKSQPRAAIGLVIVVFFVLVALTAPWLAPYGVTEKVGEPFGPPSPEHPLGLDDAGVDMLSLMMWGARVSLVVGFAAALVAMMIGGTIGLLSGYFGGRTDTALMRMTDYFLVIPDIPLMLVGGGDLGPQPLEHRHHHRRHLLDDDGSPHPVAGDQPQGARLHQARQRRRRRARAHPLPPHPPAGDAADRRNTVLTVAIAIFAETAIAFLGLGDPTLISWGKLIENAFSHNAITVDAWWAIVPPGVAVALVILGCTMVGQAIEDTLNPRLRVGHLSVRRFRLRPLQGSDQV